MPLGLHLNLTEGRPVLPPAEVPSLVRGDGSGCFRGKLGFFAAAAGGEIDEGDVLRETRAQMTSFAALAAAVGAPPQPNHLDGHNHIQAAPVVARALCRLDLPQPELRLPQPLAAAAGGGKMQSQMDALSPFLQRVVCMTMDSARPVLRSHDTAPPLASDVLLGLDLMGAALTREALLAAIDRCISGLREEGEGREGGIGGSDGETARWAELIWIRLGPLLQPVSSTQSSWCTRAMHRQRVVLMAR